MTDHDVEKVDNNVDEEAVQDREQHQETVEDNVGENAEASEAEETSINQSNDELMKLTVAIERLEGELLEAKDQKLRAYAEAQNTKRRAEIDVEKAHKFALKGFVEHLIPVVDSLERGLDIQSSEEGASAIKEGMELTLKLFLDTLKKFNVEQISPEGEPFDPAKHQAMSQIDSPDSEPGSVVNVFQKGYLLNGQLVRPAMVIVAK